MHVPIIHDQISCCANNSGGQSPASRFRYPDTGRGQSVWDLCWRKKLWGRFLSGHFGPPPPVQLVFHIHSPFSRAIQSWQLTGSSDTQNKNSLSHSTHKVLLAHARSAKYLAHSNPALTRCLHITTSRIWKR